MNSFLQHLDYAGDICLLSQKICDIQDMILAYVDLMLNCDKTKMLSLNGGANRTIEVAVDQIEAVDRFTYLVA